jgi:chloride channel protein, CIC family
MGCLVVSPDRPATGSGRLVEEDTDAQLDCDHLMGRDDGARSLLARSSQVVLASAIVGAITGVVVAGFDRLVINVVFDRWVAHLPIWLLAFTPGVGLAAAALWLRYPGGGLSPATADEYLEAFHARKGLGVRDMLHRMVAAVATLGSGCAMGPEGPSIYLGATIGSALQRRGRAFLVGADPNLLLVAGAAAGIAAIFKAPATGAIFAIEVPFQEDLARHMLLPALVAAATGYLALVAINGTTPLFPVHGAPPLSFTDLAGAAVLGLAAGLGAKVFAAMIMRAKHMSGLAHRGARVLACGATIAVLFAIGRGLTGQSLVLTPGYGVIAWALAPNRAIGVLLAVLVLRCLATSAAVAGGGVGGLFVPLVVAGALLGRAFGAAVGSTDSLFLVIGVAAFLGAGYRVPLAAVVFVAETTGRPGFVVPGLIAAVVAELVMNRASVTAYQRRPKPGMAD